MSNADLSDEIHRIADAIDARDRGAGTFTDGEVAALEFLRVVVSEHALNCPDSALGALYRSEFDGDLNTFVLFQTASVLDCLEAAIGEGSEDEGPFSDGVSMAERSEAIDIWESQMARIAAAMRKAWVES